VEIGDDFHLRQGQERVVGQLERRLDEAARAEVPALPVEGGHVARMQDRPLDGGGLAGRQPARGGHPLLQQLAIVLAAKVLVESHSYGDE